MWRPVDFRCDVCGSDLEEFVYIPIGGERPSEMILHCHRCNDVTIHHSVIGLPAPYMGEKILNPQMYGGTYDTMGAREMEDLPDLPGQAEHSAKMRKSLSKFSDAEWSSMPKRERDAAIGEACKDAPSSADYASLFAKPEYKEVEHANQEIAKQNRSKRKRAKAIARGENVNMRRDKCPGDPKITA